MRTLSTVILATSLACASGSTASDVPEITPGESFRLSVGEEARLTSADLTVRFSAVTSDSRCPKDVQCFWAGDAAVEVVLTRDEESATVSVHTHGDEPYPRETNAMGYTLRLEGLEPYPTSKGKIAPEDYVATLQLTTGASASPEDS